MEKYVENYFEKLNEFEKNRGKFAALRGKEASFISMLNQSYVSLLESTEPYIYFCGQTTEKTDRSREEVLQEHENNRKKILEFYSKNCDNADDLYLTLQKQYNELKLECIDLLKYGCFNAEAFSNYLANLISVVEGEDYGYKKVLYVDYDGYENDVYVIASDNISAGKKFSSLDELRESCIGQGALLLGNTESIVDKKYSVFEMDKTGIFLEWKLFVPEKLSYMKYAVSNLINLRIERKDEHVSKETMEIFEDGFFSSVVEKVEENYALRDRELDAEISDKEEATRLCIDGIKRKKKTNSEQLASFMAKYKPKIEE